MVYSLPRFSLGLCMENKFTNLSRISWLSPIFATDFLSLYSTLQGGILIQKSICKVFLLFPNLTKIFVRQ
jgi:hypothetical protein